MKCRLCVWLCDRLCPPESRKAVWDAVFDWEEKFASDWEPAEGDKAVRQRWAEAKGLRDRDPAAALAIHLGLAEDGSPFSMLMVGSIYEYGTGTAKDVAAAEDFYRRALCAGSWKATIRYAKLLFDRGAHEAWPSTLRDGVDKGFIPSFFWLAWYTYKRTPCARTAREMRPLLEAATEVGHPGAALMLARWTALGRFGLRQIPHGFRMFRKLAEPLVEGHSAADQSSAQLASEPLVVESRS